MFHARQLSILMLALLFTLLAYTVLGQDVGDDVSRQTLKGLKSIRVNVDPVGHNAEKAGLDPLRIRAEIEQYLEQANVPVLQGDAAFEKPLDSYFHVKITLVKGKFRTWSYAISAEVLQPGVLKSNGQGLFVSTWQRGEVGNTTTGKLGNLRTTIGDYARIFATDYNDMNPGSKPAAPVLPVTGE